MRASGNLYDAKKTNNYSNNYVVIKYILPFLKNNMIIRKNTPCIGGRGVPSPARKHANVFRSAFWER